MRLDQAQLPKASNHVGLSNPMYRNGPPVNWPADQKGSSSRELY